MRRQAARRYLTAMPIVPQMIAVTTAGLESPERVRAFAREIRADVLEAELLEAADPDLHDGGARRAGPVLTVRRSGARQRRRWSGSPARVVALIGPEIKRAMRAAFGE